MTFYSNIACAEKPDSVSVDFDRLTGDITATVDLMTGWNTRWALVSDLLNNYRAFPNYGAGAPVALKCAVRPFGEMFTLGQCIYYSDAIVTVTYGPPKFGEIGSYDIVAESLEPSAEFRRLPFQNFRWSSKTGDPLVEEESPGKLEIKLTLVRQIFKVPTPLNVLTLSATGKVHSAEYFSPLLGLTFAAESLLYSEPSFERTIRNDGSDGVNYTQKWSIKPTGWNKFWRAKTNSYEYMYQTTDSGSDPYKPYVPMNLEALLG